MAFRVGQWCHAGPPFERPDKRTWLRKPNFVRDVFDPEISRVQKAYGKVPLGVHLELLK